MSCASCSQAKSLPSKARISARLAATHRRLRRARSSRNDCTHRGRVGLLASRRAPHSTPTIATTPKATFARIQPEHQPRHPDGERRDDATTSARGHRFRERRARAHVRARQRPSARDGGRAPRRRAGRRSRRSARCGTARSKSAGCHRRAKTRAPCRQSFSRCHDSRHCRKPCRYRDRRGGVTGATRAFQHA